MRLPGHAELLARVAPARAAWGRAARPTRIDPVGAGEESVWDFPRPPRVEPVDALARVVFAGREIARSARTLRVVETAGAPCIYFPPEDVALDALVSGGGASVCEWKGVALALDVVVRDRVARGAAWTYPEPLDDLGMGYARIAGRIAFYVAPMDGCWLGDEQVAPQPGGFYGGWVTSRLRGPIKGGPGSAGW